MNAPLIIFQTVAPALLLLLSGLGANHADDQREAAIPTGMVLVPAGNYTPFFRTEREPKSIAVKPFFLDALPVTNGDYLEFVRANPKWRRSQVKPLFVDQDYLKLWAADLEIGPGVDLKKPVTHVSWFAAKAYCTWKGRRLPTTAEWEYVASASTTRPDGGNDADFVRQVRVWYSSPAPAALPPVGRGNPNYFGVHDLHGLIWEWVADFNTAMVTGDARGDTGLERQLFCGSGSQGAKDMGDYPAFMRYAFRSSLKANYTIHNLGFRSAKDL